MGVFIRILSKILLCLTLQAWLLAASGSSTPAGESGAEGDSLTFPKVASQNLREGRNPASSIVILPSGRIVMLLGAGLAPKGCIW